MLLAEVDHSWIIDYFDVVRPWLPWLYDFRKFMDVREHPALALFERMTVSEVVQEIRGQIRFRLSYASDPLDADSFSELWRQDVGFHLAAESRGWSVAERQSVVTLLVRHQHAESITEVRREMNSRFANRRWFAVRLAYLSGLTELFDLASKLALNDDYMFNLLWELVWDKSQLHHDVKLKHFDLELLKRFFERAVIEAPPSKDIDFHHATADRQYTHQRLRGMFATAIADSNTQIGLEFVDTWSKVAHFKWVGAVARGAQHRSLEASWKPPELAEIVKLTLDGSKRYLATQRDLHDAVLLAIETIRPAVETQEIYWRDMAKGLPALEPGITQNLRLLLEPHLKDAIVNAEVSCLAGRTDIQVEAIANAESGERSYLKCVIEAKLCRNPNLLVGIEKQLVKKYLAGQAGHTGIYLVLWFCPGDGCRCGFRDGAMKTLQRQAILASSTSSVSVAHFRMLNRSKAKHKSRSRG